MENQKLSHARRVFHRVMEEVKNIACNTQNLNYLKQVVFDPTPDLKITQLPELSEAELPVVSMQTQLPQMANKTLLLGQKYDRVHAGPFSEATKHAIRQSHLPIDISDLPFYGYGIHDRNDVVNFFLGVTGSRWHQNVAKDSIASISALQTRFATVGSGLQKLLVDVTTELCKMRLFKILTFGSAKPQWVTYCIWDPTRKFFYLDTVAWNAYGPVPGKWNVNLVSTYVALEYQPQLYSILFPIIIDCKKQHCLFSGHGVNRLCDECQLCTRESDVEACCHYHSSAAVQPSVYRAIAVIDDEHKFQIIQTESAPQGLGVWRVLVVSAQHASQIRAPIESSFVLPTNPCHLELSALQQQVCGTAQGSRFQHFEKLWTLFSQGTDHFEDAWYHVVVAYVWNLPTPPP